MPGPGTPKPLVLLVEDDPVFRKDLARELTDRGFSVICAANVRDGITFLTQTPKVLMMELSLPDGNGVEVLREARRRGQDPTCVVVTVVTHQMEMFSEMAQFQPDHIVLKPTTPGVVVDWMTKRFFGGAAPAAGRPRGPAGDAGAGPTAPRVISEEPRPAGFPSTPD